MGDFDRYESNNNAPKEGETKKLAAVLILGVLLIGVVAFEFLKKSPASAVGAPNPAPNGILPAPVVDGDISSSALTAMIGDLKNDPTKNLLRPVAATVSTLDEMPRNPFLMSPQWTKDLTKVEPPPVVPTPQVVIIPQNLQPPTPILPPVPKGLSAPDYKLNTVIKADVMNAIINGKIVHVGDIVESSKDSARVIEIRDNSVFLQNAKFIDGPLLELKMGPR